MKAVGANLLTFDSSLDSPITRFLVPKEGRRGRTQSVVGTMQQDRPAATAIYPVPDEAAAVLARHRLTTSHGIHATPALGQ